MRLIGRFLRDEHGATAVEYGLIVSMIGLALVVALGDLGQALAGIFSDVTRVIDNVSFRMR